MTEIIIKELCPWCHRKTIVYEENEDGVANYCGCQHCDATLKNSNWAKQAWFVARYLQPKRIE